MLGQAIGDLLPVAAAVALSPIPVIAVVLVLGSRHARTSGPAFAVGWVIGLTAVSVIALVVTSGSDDPASASASGVHWGKAALGALFVALAVREWRKRPTDGATPELPSWMDTVDHIGPPKAFVLGLMLSGANPKNLALSLAAGASIAQAGLDGSGDLLAIAAFVVIGSCTVAGSVLAFLVAPSRVAAPLDRIRQFMVAHNAVIMMVVFVLIGAKLLGDALGGLWS